jgi:hypothetical protein
MDDNYEENDKFDEFIKNIDDRLDTDICYMVLVVLGGILATILLLFLF